MSLPRQSAKAITLPTLPTLPVTGPLRCGQRLQKIQKKYLSHKILQVIKLLGKIRIKIRNRHEIAVKQQCAEDIQKKRSVITPNVL